MLTDKQRAYYKIPPFRVITKDPCEKDPEYRGFLRENKWWSSDYIAPGKEPPEALTCGVVGLDKFRILHDILLSIGGFETCFPSYEEDMDKILGRGYFRKGTSKMMLGRPNKCHANACDLYEGNIKKGEDVKICTGYALSEDGIWRQHSWLLHTYQNQTQTRTRVIETTAKRVAYFGFDMTTEEAEEFCSNNY